MTARVQRDFQFVAGIYVGNEFFMNVFELTVSFLVETDNILEQNLALARMKFMCQEAFENSVFVYDKDTDAIERFATAGMKVCLLPEEPYDQIIGIMAFCKLDAITEGRVKVTDVYVTSKLCDGVTYLYAEEDDLGPFQLKGWWNDSSPKTYEKAVRLKSKKIVKLTKSVTSWEDVGLNWADEEKSKDEGAVVFVNFDHKQGK